MKKILILILVVLIVIFGVVYTKDKSSDQPETNIVKIGYVPLVHGLPLFLAVEKGYFTEVGLEVEPIRFEAPNQLIDALLNGQIDLGAPGAATGITMIAESKQPGSFKIFAGNGSDENHITESIIVKKNSTIGSINDLKGKKVGIFPGIQWRTISKEIFAKNNLSTDTDVTLVELAIPLQVQALESGQVDAVIALEPVVTIATSKGIAKVLVPSPAMKYIAAPFYGGVGNISTTFLNQSPDTTRKVVAVFKKATEEINADPDSARVFLKGYTPLDADLSKIVTLPFFKMYTDFSAQDISAIQKFVDIFYENKIIETKVDVENVIYK